LTFVALVGLRGDGECCGEAARAESNESKDFSDEDGDAEERLDCPSSDFCACVLGCRRLRRRDATRTPSFALFGGSARPPAKTAVGARAGAAAAVAAAAVAEAAVAKVAVAAAAVVAVVIAEVAAAAAAAAAAEAAVARAVAAGTRMV
jgi:hypothetical protein